jgi:solute carrier family 8 (sodium/calcium exchanger)
MSNYVNATIATLLANLSDPKVCTTTASVCKPGVILPVWTPQTNITLGDTIARAVVYAVGLMYLFLGVSIIADRFMAAIEVITSQEREIHVTDSNGNKQVVMVRYWNETVSNLTLMALGSSAPEILLSIIEIFGNKFEAGDLGPNTIVGSAAYNLFVIIGYCILVVPKGETRRIKHLRVFFVTATWSVFAYIWLYLIISFFSVGEVELWEAVLTFLFFPLTVLTAYIVDKKIFFGNFLEKKLRSTKLIRGDEEAGYANNNQGADQPLRILDSNGNELKDQSHASNEYGLESSFNNPDIKNFEDHRREYINILKELRQKNPDIGIDELQKMAEVEILKRGPKSRAYYRIQATRKLIGGTSNVKKKIAEKEKSLASKSKSNLESIVEVDPNLQSVSFDPAHYTCFESVGSLEVYVSRSGGDLNRTVLVDYKTEDGSAEANSDYVYSEGTLVFGPNELRKHFVINIIDDDVYEEDEHFYVRLLNARYDDGTIDDNLKVASPDLATVMILDDDHGGVFLFNEPKMEVIESIGQLRIKVTRTSGARGKVKIPYRTIDATAIGGRDYEKKNDLLVFYNNEIEKFIDIDIVDDEDYQKNESFFVELGEPIVELNEKNEPVYNEAGMPRLGDVKKIEIQIKESKVIKGIVDKLLISNASSILVGTSSWKEQFIEALKVNADDDEDEEEEEPKEGEEKEEKEPKQPTCGDYFIHFVSLFWKILFAFVPPTDIWGGWACFVVSIIIIGILTAVIGDLASHFGCTVGLKDSVTAISFVALGTSLPDTFASKVAAIQDKYADSSVGNVTGSNAVNVFLGIGLAWTAAAFYHTWNGTKFVVVPGSLAFSVTLFCSFALLAITLMMIRRNPKIGGELGGPTKSRIFTSSLFFGLWLLYLLLSSLETYCVIKGF